MLANFFDGFLLSFFIFFLPWRAVFRRAEWAGGSSEMTSSPAPQKLDSLKGQNKNILLWKQLACVADVTCVFYAAFVLLWWRFVFHSIIPCFLWGRLWWHRVCDRTSLLEKQVMERKGGLACCLHECIIERKQSKTFRICDAFVTSYLQAGHCARSHLWPDGSSSSKTCNTAFFPFFFP